MSEDKIEIVAVIGASPKENRYSNKAMKMLMDYGHTAIPICVYAKEILDQIAYKSVLDYQGKIDTVTLYVGPLYQEKVIEEILTLKPNRVIFNPGTESSESYQKLDQAGITYVEACTLVMLSTAQF